MYQLGATLYLVDARKGIMIIQQTPFFCTPFIYW